MKGLKGLDFIPGFSILYALGEGDNPSPERWVFIGVWTAFWGIIGFALVVGLIILNP